MGLARNSRDSISFRGLQETHAQHHNCTVEAATHLHYNALEHGDYADVLGSAAQPRLAHAEPCAVIFVRAHIIMNLYSLCIVAPTRVNCEGYGIKTRTLPNKHFIRTKS